MNLSRCAALAAAAMLVLAGPAFAVETAPTLEMSADGQIQIGPDGSVTDYRLDSKLPPAVAELVDKDVRRWQFEPILADGKPVVAKTAMHLGLRAEPAGEAKDSYRMHIVEIRFGEPKRSGSMRPPHYPKEAVIAHLGARVMLAVRLGADGQATDVQAYQTSLDARPRSESDAEHWRAMFERASIDAAKSWRYNMTETVNGKTVGSSVLVPVVFSVHVLGSQSDAPGTWKAYLPGPKHPAPWMDSDRLAATGDLSNLRDDEAVSLDSPFKLKDDVVGKAL